MRKNMMTKNIANGRATRNTSMGSCTIIFPLRLNITTIVKSSAIKVIGEIFGRNFVLNQTSPFCLIRTMRLITASINGMPK